MRVCIISNNSDFQDDLVLQMTKYVEGFVWDNDKPDVIVVDENVKKAAQMRQIHPSVPLILLTAENTAEVEGANQIIHKPFSLWHLLDAVLSANSKQDNSKEGRLVFNNYELHPNTRIIIDLPSQNETKLTEKEVDILKYLYKYQNEFVSKNDLQTNVWQYNEDVDTHTIETHIYRLRQKVEQSEDRRLIVTENGKYKLNMED